MPELPEHPMDGFPVRPLQFDLERLELRDVVWSRTCPEFSVFINALALHVPHFERYLVKAMRRAKEQIDDPGLRRDISAIIGQEAHHARNFLRFNARLAQRYPKVAQHDAEAAAYFKDHAEQDTLKQLVGYTAGYETFTFLAGMIILQNYARWFADSEPTLKALTHIALQTLKTYPHMAKVEGWLRNPFTGAYKLGFCVLMLLRLLRAALPVFRRDYHPRKHPIATTAQNPIQIAWRRYAHAGGDVLSIDRARMAEMLDLAQPG